MLTTPILFLSALAASVFAAPTEKRAAAVIPGVEWKVTNFSRACTTTACPYSFIINVIASGTTNTVACGFTYTHPSNAAGSASTDSFNSIPCAPSSVWSINWGYSNSGDFSVMTILNSANVSAKQDAYFGYNGVAQATKFPDVGPQPVYAEGTFS